MAYRNVSTPELSEGDVVNCHGLRCLIDRPLTLSLSHPGGQTYYVRALVLNRDEVPNAVVPIFWTERDCEDGEHRWTIQGSERARWFVEL